MGEIIVDFFFYVKRNWEKNEIYRNSNKKWEFLHKIALFTNRLSHCYILHYKKRMRGFLYEYEI